MLVTVAVLVIIMTILVQIFQAATGALSAAQTIQELDNQLKLLDSTIRSDLGGVTAQFTPPLDPAQNLGYFEYGENEFADIQGEDSDDYSASPPRPRRASRSPAGCGSHSTGANRGHEQRRTFSRSRSPASTPRSSISSATATCTAGCCWSPPSSSRRSHQATNNVDANGNAILPRGLGRQPGQSEHGQQRELARRQRPVGPSSRDWPHHERESWPGRRLRKSIVLNTLGMLTNRENRSYRRRLSDDFATLREAYGKDGYSLRRNHARRIPTTKMATRCRTSTRRLSQRFPPRPARRRTALEPGNPQLRPPTASRGWRFLISFPAPIRFRRWFRPTSTAGSIPRRP